MILTDKETNRLEKIANIQVLKYVISKQMFCKYSGKCLDYKNAIMMTLDKTDVVIDGSFAPKIEEIKKAFMSKGHKVDFFVNVKSNQLNKL
tara:strand:- start:544 stop:816 length:273 start_codon:yes stop_codon:yes gene_type:complete